MPQEPSQDEVTATDRGGHLATDGGGSAGPEPSYADLIVRNGKVVTVDDDAINDDPGTIVDGLVVREGEIVARTEGEEYEAWVGPETEVVDLEGRTVLPGIIDSHSHLYEFGARMMGKATYPDRFRKQRVLLTKDYDSSEQIRDDMIEAVEQKTEELDEGEFILVRTENPIIHSNIPDDVAEFSRLDIDPEDERYNDIYREVSRNSRGFVLGKEVFENDMITKEDLDELAPNHPVLLMSHPFYIPNERAFEWYEEEYGQRPRGDESVDLYRVLLFDVFLEGDPKLIAEMIRNVQEVYLRNGITSYGTHVYPMTPLDAYAQLDRNDEVRPRLSWGTTNLFILNPDSDTFHKRVTAIHGTGSDFMWNGGVSLAAMDLGPPSIATTLDAPPEVKDREFHEFLKEGNTRRESLANIAERGGRFASSNHTLGDRAVDKIIDTILEGSERGGLSKADIRERMHGIDHGGLYPRPDQIERCKEYNIRLNLNVWESWRIQYLEGFLDDYPEEEQERAEGWMAAAKTALDGGLKVGWHGKELENPFPYIGAFVTRMWDGDEITPELAIDRVKALKMATTWNAEYLLREDLGSLEVGNRADFVVLDRDYLEVPEDEIKEISPVMTAVDGDILYRHQSI